MKPKFLIDENIPLQVARVLKGVGYDVLTVPDVAQPGIKNDQLAGLGIRIKRILVTRDADFTRLKRGLAKEVRVVYINLKKEPKEMAQLIIRNIDECISLLRRYNIVTIDEEGCHRL